MFLSFVAIEVDKVVRTCVEESDKSGSGWKDEDHAIFIILYIPVHTASLARKDRPNLLDTHPSCHSVP